MPTTTCESIFPFSLFAGGRRLLSNLLIPPWCIPSLAFYLRICYHLPSCQRFLPFLTKQYQLHLNVLFLSTREGKSIDGFRLRVEWSKRPPSQNWRFDAGARPPPPSK